MRKSFLVFLETNTVIALETFAIWGENFEPVKKVLEDAELRYRFWQTKSYYILIVIAMLFIGAGTFLIFYIAFSDKFTFMQIFIGVQSIYIFVIGISIAIGFFAWVKEMKPIWLSIKRLLKELEE